MVSAQCTLICNEGIQVSLDPSGHALITTQLITPNAASSCPGALELTLVNNVGLPLPNPLTCNNIGQTVTAKVRHLATGNFCTSDLEVIDAMSPALNCPNKFVFCNQDASPAEVGLPTASDNCTSSNNLALNYFDTETTLGCGVMQNGQPVLKRIDRIWTAVDEQGNSSTCNQKIWIKHIQASNINYPLNRDNISAPALVCGDDPEDLSLTGEPTVAGIPVGASVDCEIAVAYTDQIINHCLPASYTVVRTWTTIDFCNGTVSSRVQLIKVEDKVAPVLIAPSDITIGTDGFTCTGSLTLPQASATDNCSAISILPQWQFGSGYGPYSSISVGTHVVTYKATDGCGNSSTATMQVSVEDTSPPQAICSSDLQVSLSASGGAYLNAGTIGVNSSDNCSGPVSLDLSRDAENYAAQLLFTCSDIGMPILVTLRVTDAVGLENFCESEISVRDFLKPNIQCPPAATLNCLQDPLSLLLTGQATATDNCVLGSIFYQDNAVISACNVGSITRTWKAVDGEGNLKSCNQNITLNAINTTTVVFPTQVQINGCSTPDAIYPDATGWPQLGGQACSELSINYTDHIFPGIPPFCKRIQRDWKVVDHCLYNPNGGSTGIWEHAQIIDIVDNIPPLLLLPADVTIAAQQDCSAAVTLDDVLAIDCNIQIAVSNNSAFAVASGPNASGNYPIGEHVVTFSATDACGNSAGKTFKIIVTDQTAPNAVCVQGLTVNVDSSGVAVLDAQVFDGGSTDNCSGGTNLLFSLSPDMFSCQSLGLHTITLFVRDTAGNTSTCGSSVNVLDPNHVCGGSPGYIFDGTIRTPTGMAVRNIPVHLTGAHFMETVDCDTLGYFSFQDVPQGETLKLRPVNNANWLNGVTTFDLVLISKHILGIAPLSSPLKMIAADANRSNSITTFDIVQLRKVLLGILDTVPGNMSWRFIDSSFVFQDTLNPFTAPFPEELVFNNLNANQLSKNFTAQKIGDVNDSTDPANARNPQDTVFLDLGNLNWRAGEQLVLPVFMPQWLSLEGLQFELEFDADKVVVEGIDFPVPAVFNERNVALLEGNQLRVSWDNVLPQDLQSHTMFNLRLRGMATSIIQDAVKLKYERLIPEAYRSENEGVAAIKLSKTTKSENLSGFTLYLYPNPSAGTFQCENPLKKEAERLRILDGMGRVVWEQNGTFPDVITISLNGFLPGIYLLELSGKGQRASGRLLIR